MGLIDLINKLPTQNELTGSFGEWLTKYYTKMMSDTLILHDVLIDAENGFKSQIDLIMVGIRGIYVIEVKTFTDAKIYGDYNKSRWYYYRSGKKFEIYSPVKQNEKHIKYIKNLLKDFGDVPVFSIITMICDDFKVSNMSGDINNLQTVICNSLPAMTKGLMLFSENKPIVFEKEKQQQIYDCILDNQYEGKEARQKHKESVKEYQKILEENKNQKNCPYCNKPLVLRNGKYGEFYGCSNYPNCRYTSKE